MATVGLIVEYNPLHNGHVHHYTRSKEITGAESSVAVLSGPFLQRGEPGIVSKFARTEMALAMGADLIIELPVAYAPQPAEWFAYGAVSLLSATGIVDSLCFGTESGSLDLLLPLSKMLAQESGEMKDAIASFLSEGMSYPAAYSAAAAAMAVNLGEEDDLRKLLQQPNHTLGLHYLIALQRIGSPIHPFTIPRLHAGYHDDAPAHATITSATAVRRMLLEQDLQAAAPYLPSFTLDILRREFEAGRGPMTWESFRQPLMQLLLTERPQALSELHEVTEGLEYRLQRLLPTLSDPSVGALLQALKTKRYTHTKLQRMLVHILLQHTQTEMTQASLTRGPGYIRVLGFSGRGQELLKTMKKTASLPIVVKPPSMRDDQLELDLRASAAYANAYKHPLTKEIFRDYFMPPIMT
ncbi:nucleotidyltransferase [Paenibacillus pini]|uniref:tRNA(Met) cytidine acetate ligase n=1 Tax=Paenibacillus pini JCM 16418 TaxID=1236976 RepID=W7Y6Y9_9BACL|nr:nucleotidyltransferase [Paenibacillus pini]GAF06700.1 hypothetical protein JCM16418_674 [Paenibacillus pini JCM 16418]